MNKTYGTARRRRGVLVTTLLLSWTVAALPGSMARAVPVEKVAYAVVGEIPVGDAPSGVAVSGSRAYVTNSGSDNVSVIDTSNNTVTATIVVDDAPSAIAINPAGTRAYVTNSGSDNVSVIDTDPGSGTFNTVTATIIVGDAPSAIAINPAASRAYVTNSGTDNVSVIDTSNNTVTATINVGDNPVDLAVSPDGANVWVANLGGNSVSVIRTSDNTVTATRAIGAPVRAVTFYPVAATYNGSTFFYGYTATDRPNPNNSPSDRWDVFTDPDAGALFFPQNFGGMPSSGQNDSDPVDIAISSNGVTHAVVLEGADSLALQESAGFGYRISTGDAPSGVGLTPGLAPNAGLPVYVTNRGSDTVSVITRVKVTLSTSSGPAGSTMTLDVTAPNVTFPLPDDAISSVKFGAGSLATPTAGPGDTWTVTVPPSEGSFAHSVTVTFKGQLNVSAFFANYFTYTQATSTSPVLRASLDPNGGSCVDGSTRTEVWTSEFVGYRYLPGPGGCTRPGFVFSGWANSETPSVTRNLPLVDDPSSGERGYLIAEDADLVAVWTARPATPSVFAALPRFLCVDSCVGTWFVWDDPTGDPAITITDDTGRTLCADRTVRFPGWSICHEPTVVADRSTFTLVASSGGVSSDPVTAMSPILFVATPRFFCGNSCVGTWFVWNNPTGDPAITITDDTGRKLCTDRTVRFPGWSICHEPTVITDRHVFTLTARLANGTGIPLSGTS